MYKYFLVYSVYKTNAFWSYNDWVQPVQPYFVGYKARGGRERWGHKGQLIELVHNLIYKEIEVGLYLYTTEV